MDRVGIALVLAPGTRARAEELIAQGPPFDLAEAGFERHAILLGNDQAVFIFEGQDAEQLVREIVDDPVRSASLSAWAPLLAEPPRLVRDVFSWER